MSVENLCFACTKEISSPLLYCDSCLANIIPESVCEHGSLKRSCAVCEVVAERDVMLAERDAEIERMRVRAQELSDLAYSYEQRSKEAQDAVIAYECDRQILIDGLASANGEIERLQKELRDALDAESTNARNAAHYCSLLSEATDHLAAERQRARLPDDLVELAREASINPINDKFLQQQAWQMIVEAVEQKP